MCGRFALIADKQSLANKLVAGCYADIDYVSYNITPTSKLPIVYLSGNNEVTTSMMHWGLIPIWQQTSEKPVNHPINARIETAAQKVSFREALKKRRCLIPAAGFYEWDKSLPKKPYYIYSPQNKIITFAGIWNCHVKDNQQNYSFAILTKEATSQIANIHNRMPVIIDQNYHHCWLESGRINSSSARLNFHRISTNINNPQNNNCSLLTEII